MGSEYYQSAKTWYEDRYEILQSSLYRYRVLSLGLGILLALSLVSLSILMPLKQYIYRMISLNENTGEVVTLKEIDPKAYNTKWAVTRFFVNQYVLNRNLYHYDDYLRTYNTALALSDTNNAKILHNEFIYTNPASPLNTLKKEQFREAIILSINALNVSTAIIRFKTLIHNKTDGNILKKGSWQAIVKWKYGDPPSEIDYKDINPLGFYVTYYQVSPIVNEVEE